MSSSAARSAIPRMRPLAIASVIAASLLAAGAAFGQSPPGDWQPREAQPDPEVLQQGEVPPPADEIRDIPPESPLLSQDDRIQGEDPAAPNVQVPFTGTIGWGWAFAGIVAAAILAYLSRLGVRSMRRRASA